MEPHNHLFAGQIGHIQAEQVLEQDQELEPELEPVLEQELVENKQVVQVVVHHRLPFLDHHHKLDLLLLGSHNLHCLELLVHCIRVV